MYSQILQSIPNKAKCFADCRNFSIDTNNYNFTIPGLLQAYENKHTNTSSSIFQFNDDILGSLIDIHLPSTCTYKTWLQSQQCTFSFNTPLHNNTDIQFTIAQCPGASLTDMPYISITGNGGIFADFLQPCIVDSDCIGKSRCSMVPDGIYQDIIYKVNDVLVNVIQLIPPNGCSYLPNSAGNAGKYIIDTLLSNYKSSVAMSPLNGMTGGGIGLCGIESFTSISYPSFRVPPMPYKWGVGEVISFALHMISATLDYLKNAAFYVIMQLPSTVTGIVNSNSMNVSSILWSSPYGIYGWNGTLMDGRRSTDINRLSGLIFHRTKFYSENFTVTGNDLNLTINNSNNSNSNLPLFIYDFDGTFGILPSSSLSLTGYSQILPYVVNEWKRLINTISQCSSSNPSFGCGCSSTPTSSNATILPWQVNSYHDITCPEFWLNLFSNMPLQPSPSQLSYYSQQTYPYYTYQYRSTRSILDTIRNMLPYDIRKSFISFPTSCTAQRYNNSGICQIQFTALESILNIGFIASLTRDTSPTSSSSSSSSHNTLPRLVVDCYSDRGLCSKIFRPYMTNVCTKQSDCGLRQTCIQLPIDQLPTPISAALWGSSIHNFNDTCDSQLIFANDLMSYIARYTGQSTIGMGTATSICMTEYNSWLNRDAMRNISQTVIDGIRKDQYTYGAINVDGIQASQSTMSYPPLPLSSSSATNATSISLANTSVTNITSNNIPVTITPPWQDLLTVSTILYYMLYILRIAKNT